MTPERELQQGDTVRLRPLGSPDEWCTGMVILISGTSVLICLDGALRINDGVAIGAVALTIDKAHGMIFSALPGPETEMELEVAV